MQPCFFTENLNFGSGNLTSDMTSVSVYYDLRDDVDKVKLRLVSVYQDDVTIDIDGFDVITHDFTGLRPGSFYDVIIETSEDGYFYSENIGTVSTGSYYEIIHVYLFKQN